MTLSQLDLISVHREKKSQQSLWKYEVGAPLTPLTLLVCVGGGHVCAVLHLAQYQKKYGLSQYLLNLNH